VVIPTRRSTAEAGQILLSHALGDAGSPYLIGLVSDSLKKVLHYPSSSDGLMANTTDILITGLNMTMTTVASPSAGQDSHNMTANLIEFRSLQYSLFITSFVEVLGGLFFLMTAWYIISDKKKCDDIIHSSSGEPSKTTL